MERIAAWRRPGASGVVYRADALDLLRGQPSGSADIVFLDPPFNLGKTYSSENPSLDRKDPDKYAHWLKIVLAESVRVLADGGALYLYHMPEWASRATVILNEGLLFRHWIAISMKNGFARGEKLYPAHYALLYYTKGKPKYFSRPKISPVECRHCGGFVKDYGGYTEIIREKGVNLSDVWDDISPIRHRANKHRHANELPTTICDRVVTISGVRDGIFLDPFAGAGSTLISAARAGMRFRAGDILLQNCRLISKRVTAYKQVARSTIGGCQHD